MKYQGNKVLISTEEYEELKALELDLNKLRESPGFAYDVYDGSRYHSEMRKIVVLSKDEAFERINKEYLASIKIRNELYGKISKLESQLRTITNTTWYKIFAK